MKNPSAARRNSRTAWHAPILVLAILAGFAGTCGNSYDRNLFQQGHKLKGKYVNSEHGVHRSFIFREDGTVVRITTTEPNVPPVDTNKRDETIGPGTYELVGKEMTIKFSANKVASFDISISGEGGYQRYQELSPDTLKISDHAYTKVD
jgi:hypothetical protein